MKSENKAIILLCTYNADKYICEQMESLINQTYPHIDIMIYDDNSSDNTLNFINEISKQTSRRIIVKKSEVNSGGAKNNFLRAINENRDKQYIFFCDQDDIWELDKVEKVMRVMIAKEKEKMQPYVICHDCFISDSYGRDIGINSINNTDFAHLLFYPEIQGCCMAVNNDAIKKIDLDENFIVMHDWIISLYVSLHGEIVVVNECLVHYRQHNDNQVGYRRYSLMQRILKLKELQKKKVVFRGILNQMYLLSKSSNDSFLGNFSNLYLQNNRIGIVELFFRTKVLKFGLHGFYQAFMILIT